MSAGKLKRSVDPLVSGGGIDQLEGFLSALLKDVLGIEALVLVVTVGGHAGTELLEVIGTLLLEDVLARGTLIFSFEAARCVSMLRGEEGSLQDDALVGKSRFSCGTTEHVDHVFHWHVLRES